MSVILLAWIEVTITHGMNKTADRDLLFSTAGPKIIQAPLQGSSALVAPIGTSEIESILIGGNNLKRL